MLQFLFEALRVKIITVIIGVLMFRILRYISHVPHTSFLLFLFSDDSWLDGDNNDDFNSDTGERIYSGRTSPKKRYHGDGSANIHRGISASTIDSFDNAYNKKPPSASTQRTVDTVQEKDDFFDS